MIGETFARRYQVVERLGEGGMALVYRAQDLLLGRPVALKVLRAQLLADEELVARFHQEAQAAASLSHPNVVSIYDVGEDRGTPFIVMEYVPGRNLKEVLRERGRLPASEAVPIACQVLEAVAHAHARGIVHRDIKPHNILLAGDGRVKVADFGIARAMASARTTQSGTVLGSVHYFAPEQARGHPAGVASDLYAVGVVLYEMLTGRVPFEGENPVSVALKHLQEEPPPIEQLAPGVPPRLARAVRRAMAKEPGQRFPSAKAFAEELVRVDPRLGGSSGRVFAFRPGAEPVTAGRAVADRLAGESPTRPYTPPSGGLVAEAGGDGLAASRDPGEGEEEGGRSGGEGVTVGTRIRANGRQERPRRRTGFYLALFLLAFLAGLGWAATTLPEYLFPPVVEVPNVVGFSRAEAESRLAQRGLRLRLGEPVYDPDTPAGHVVDQEPRGGETVRQQRAVEVRLSRGPEMVAVPDVTGLPLREARVRLTGTGLVIGEQHREYHPEVPAGHVLRQSPAGGGSLPRGSPVDLVVSQGPEPGPRIGLPDFTGMRLEEVEARLGQLGLAVGNVYPDRRPDLPPGVVIDQNPAPGQEVQMGWTVDFVVNLPDAAGDTLPPDVLWPETPAAVPGSAGGPIREADVHVRVPPGAPQEVLIVVSDDEGFREVYRRRHPGGDSFVVRVRGRGEAVRFQVYVGGRLAEDRTFDR